MGLRVGVDLSTCSVAKHKTFLESKACPVYKTQSAQKVTDFGWRSWCWAVVVRRGYYARQARAGFGEAATVAAVRLDAAKKTVSLRNSGWNILFAQDERQEQSRVGVGFQGGPQHGSQGFGGTQDAAREAWIGLIWFAQIWTLGDMVGPGTEQATGLQTSSKVLRKTYAP